MSKVVSQIMATATDRKRFRPKHKSQLFQDIFSVQEDIKQDPATVDTMYKIGVTLGAQCWVSALEVVQAQNENPVELAIQRTKRQVIEAIFGEFRVDFRNIERHIYNNDMENAGILLHQMEKKMFEVTTEDIEENARS